MRVLNKVLIQYPQTKAFHTSKYFIILNCINKCFDCSLKKIVLFRYFSFIVNRGTDSSCLRNKSPPTKKTKRKENHLQSQLPTCTTSSVANTYNTHHGIGSSVANNNAHLLLHQQPTQPPHRVYYVSKIISYLPNNISFV